jgi:hypothetical protein
VKSEGSRGDGDREYDRKGSLGVLGMAKPIPRCVRPARTTIGACRFEMHAVARQRVESYALRNRKTPFILRRRYRLLKLEPIPTHFAARLSMAVTWR